MGMRKGRLRAVSLGGLVGAVAALAAFTAAAAPDGTGEYVGAETCMVCHEDVVREFGRTAHAVAPGWDAERGCESCHGPGSEHVDGEGDVTKIVRPASLPAVEGSATCLACHGRQAAHFTNSHSIHATEDVGCLACHNPHAKTEKLLRATGRELCAGCHQAIAARFDLPRSHPLPENGEGCVSCHSPHATRSLRTDTSLYRETCTECHFEKAGPFLYDHDVVLVDGCVSCHDVHGSSNRHLLKHETQINLCYQCHSGNATPTWHSAPTFLNEKCTACHTAIHGSNTSSRFLEE